MLAQQVSDTAFDIAVPPASDSTDAWQRDLSPEGANGPLVE
jgi:hypothetical protein